MQVGFANLDIISDIATEGGDLHTARVLGDAKVDRLFQTLLQEITDRDVTTTCDELTGQFAANPAPTTGYDRNLSAEVSHGTPSHRRIGAA